MDKELRAALKAQAIELRSQGRSYRQIQEVVAVPLSTLSHWLREVPLTQEHRRKLEVRRRSGMLRMAQSLWARRVALEEQTRATAAAQITPLSDSELFVAGVVAYWAEGAKNEGRRRDSQRVIFTNSDPGMILLFLRWLELMGMTGDRVFFRLQIHESADVEAALRSWSRLVGVPMDEFRPTSLKRHNPSTHRTNTGEEYRGCLRVEVARGTELYRQIAGWFAGIAVNLPPRGQPHAPAAPRAVDSSGGFNPCRNSGVVQ